MTDVGMIAPDMDRSGCLFCDSWGDEGEQCSHADFLNHFGTFEDWERHPSLIIGREIGSERANAGGFYDDEDGKVDQELAEKIVDELIAAGWKMIPPDSGDTIGT